MMNLEILYQDQDILVVNKPSGLLSVPGRTPDLQDCVVARVKEMIPTCIDYPAVHRLDMDTSGVLLMALNVESLRILSRQFEQRTTSKEYEALIVGDPLLEATGRIELHFRLDPNNRPYQVYDPIEGKLGITEWFCLESYHGGITRVRLVPYTGRTHQLRLHMAHEKGLHRPIMGDRLYGTGTDPGQLKLHATTLSFDHPRTNERLTLTCQPNF